MRFAFCLPVILIAATAGAQPPASWVTIKGQVVLPADVPVPVPKPLALGPNPPACAAARPVVDESVVVDPRTRGVKNVVVWLRPDSANPKAAFARNEIHPAAANRKPGQVALDQPCCAFEPHVAAARVGDTLVVKNSAPFAHNFFWASENNGNLNVAVQPNGKFTLPNPLAAEPTSVAYSCTIHPWMKGYVRVFDHPYFAVTDDAGKFEIKDAPAGKYRLVYWHETGFKGKAAGRFGDPVVLAGGAATTMELKPTDFDVTK